MNTINKLVQNRVITEDGADWLVAAVDPFHDQDLKLAGYPDTQTASTVVQLVKTQFTVSRPSTVSAGNTWDACITMLPTFNNSGSWPGITCNTANSSTAGLVVASPYFLGGCQAYGCAAGGLMFPSQDQLQDASVALIAGYSPRQYLTGKCRIIGAAFEVVNTTAAISRQGQVTYFRQPTSGTPCSMGINLTFSSVAANVEQPYTGLRMPPRSLLDAQLLFGSRTEAAERGAYVVSRLNSTSINLDNPQTLPVGYVTRDLNVGTQANGYTVYMRNALSAVSGNSTAYFQPLAGEKVASFDISGAYFTGLSDVTTLVVNARWIIERCPTTDEPDLVVMATPSAGYDPVALEIYARAMGSMPPGVSVDENPLGEWFRTVLEQISKWAPRVGGALGSIIPIAAPIGQVVGAGAGRIAMALPGSASRAIVTAQTPSLAAQSSQDNKNKKKKKKVVAVPARVTVRIPGRK